VAVAIISGRSQTDLLRVQSRQLQLFQNLALANMARSGGDLVVAGKFKFVVGDSAIANTRAGRKLRGRKGIVVQIGPVKGEYGVEFADGRSPSLVHVDVAKLDRTPASDV
jgi:hypothetical protein